MTIYTLQWRGTVECRNITANSLKEAKEMFCKKEGVVEKCARQVYHIRKPKHYQSMA